MPQADNVISFPAPRCAIDKLPDISPRTLEEARAVIMQALPPCPQPGGMGDAAHAAAVGEWAFDALHIYSRVLFS